uniref:Single stranded DNA binding protein 4 n=1 Tax=Sphenodon punctatus TaxID=8508 RepID=A0A8D0H0K2_SPHPU
MAFPACWGWGRIQLALYVYEYLLHVGAQKSAQTFLSEIRWEKNITLGEPPGFLHSWWCVFWDLYCAAPDRRETCEHSSEAKAFHDYSAAAAPSPVMANMPPSDGMPTGPMPPGFFQPFMSPRYPGGPRPTLRMPNQPPVGVPGSQTLLPNAMDPVVRSQGEWGPCCPPAREPLAVVGNPQGRHPFPHVSLQGPPGGGGPPGTPIMPSPGDSTNSSENMYSMMNPIGPTGSRPTFPMGPGPDGPMGGMSAMEPHHMNGSLGRSKPRSSPSNMAGMTNAPGTPRDDGSEMSGNFLNPFQSDSYSPSMTMSV